VVSAGAGRRAGGTAARHALLPGALLAVVNRFNRANAALLPSPSGACPWS